MPQFIHLDVSALAPPKPMMEITKVLADLPHDGLLRVTHRREPVPLFEIIRDNFRYRHIAVAEGQHLIFIWHRDDLETADYVGTLTNENDWT
jgi:hypothetical protein